VDPSQFGVNPNRGGIVPFLEALQEQVNTHRQPQKAAWGASHGSGATTDGEAVADTAVASGNAQVGEGQGENGGGEPKSDAAMDEG
jgi:hypothetical protein